MRGELLSQLRQPNNLPEVEVPELVIEQPENVTGKEFVQAYVDLNLPKIIDHLSHESIREARNGQGSATVEVEARTFEEASALYPTLVNVSNYFQLEGFQTEEPRCYEVNMPRHGLTIFWVDKDLIQLA